jgi:hypothetical protein
MHFQVHAYLILVSTTFHFSIPFCVIFLLFVGLRQCIRDLVRASICIQHDIWVLFDQNLAENELIREKMN